MDLSSIFSTPVTCTIGAGESACNHLGHTQITNPILGIRIESSGAGLAPTDDAYIGLSVKQADGL
ncbi:MAG: hypothetical protein ABI726_02440 [bacterium]